MFLPREGRNPHRRIPWVGAKLLERRSVKAGHTGYCFIKASRLRKSADYGRVFSGRRVLHGRYFALHFVPASADAVAVPVGTRPGPRLGLVVAKRLARRAVLRNLIKRLARESFRLARSQLPELDLVLRLNKVVRKPGRENRVEAKRKAGRKIDERTDGDKRILSMRALKSELRADIQMLLARLPKTSTRFSQEIEGPPRVFLPSGHPTSLAAQGK